MEATKEKHATHTPGPWHYSEVIEGESYTSNRADFRAEDMHG